MSEYETYANQEWWKNNNKKEYRAERALAVELGEIAYIRQGRCYHTLLDITLEELERLLARERITDIKSLSAYLTRTRSRSRVLRGGERHINALDTLRTIARGLGLIGGRGFERQYIKVKVDLGPKPNTNGRGEANRIIKMMKYRQGEFAFNLSAIKLGRQNGYRGLKMIDFLNWAQEFHYKNRDTTGTQGRREGQKALVTDATKLHDLREIKYSRVFKFDEHIYRYKGRQATQVVPSGGPGNRNRIKRVNVWLWDRRTLVCERFDPTRVDHTRYHLDSQRFIELREAAKKHWDNKIRGQVLTYFTNDDILKQTKVAVISKFMRKARRSAKLGKGSFAFEGMMFQSKKAGPLRHADGVSQSTNPIDRMRHKGIFKKTPFYIDWQNPDVSLEQGSFEHMKDVASVVSICVALAQPQVGAIIKTFSKALENDGDLLNSIYEQYNAQVGAFGGE